MYIHVISKRCHFVGQKELIKRKKEFYLPRLAFGDQNVVGKNIIYPFHLLIFSLVFSVLVLNYYILKSEIHIFKGKD